MLFIKMKIINYKLIMARDFIDIAINYENGRRSILAIGKDVEGQKIFRGIYEKWLSIKDIKPHSLETEEFETTYKIKALRGKRCAGSSSQRIIE